jgi:hypothetical protein
MFFLVQDGMAVAWDNPAAVPLRPEVAAVLRISELAELLWQIVF